MRLRRRRAVKLASRSLRLTNERGAGHHSRLFIDGVDVSEMTRRVEIDNPVDGPITAKLHVLPWPTLVDVVSADVLAIFDPDPTEIVSSGAVNAMECALDVLENRDIGTPSEWLEARERAIDRLRDALDDANVALADGRWVMRTAGQ